MYVPAFSVYTVKAGVMRGSRKFFQRRSNFFLVDEGIQIPLKVGQQWPASETPNFEFWLGSFVMFQDPDQYCLETLSGGGGSDPLSPLDPPMGVTSTKFCGS